MTLFLFVILQLADLATTLLFLHRGIAEANPLIAAVLAASRHPALPLLLVKAVGCGVAWFAWKSGRRRLLRPINVLFAACVLWNGAALLCQ